MKEYDDNVSLSILYLSTLNKMTPNRSKLITISSLFAVLALAFVIFNLQKKHNLGVNSFYTSFYSEAKKATENVEQNQLFAYDEAGVKAPTENNDYLAKAKKPIEEDATNSTSDNSGANTQNSVIAGLSNINLEGENNPFWGPVNAKVKIVIFSDFLCPFCAEFALNILPQVKSAYAGKVKITFRDLPIESLHPGSGHIHEAGECAAAQGKFWEMHDLMFANNARLTSDLLPSLAQSAGLDLNIFNNCLASGAKSAQVLTNLEFGINLGIQATPTVFVNNQKMEGVSSFSALDKVIASELNK